MSTRLKFIIYYRNSTIISLITNNDQSPPCDDLQKTNLVYEFTCPEDGCEHVRNSYIGVTQTSLSRKMTMRKALGGPMMHLNESHNKPLTCKTPVQNTKIIHQKNHFLESES